MTAMLRQGSLADRTFAEEDTRHAAAKAAIRARLNDIADLERLVTQLLSRGFHAAAMILTRPIGEACSCELTLSLSATPNDLKAVLEWLASDSIEVARNFERDMGQVIYYQLKLGKQNLRMCVFLYEARSPRHPATGDAHLRGGPDAAARV